MRAVLHACVYSCMWGHLDHLFSGSSGFSISLNTSATLPSHPLPSKGPSGSPPRPSKANTMNLESFDYDSSDDVWVRVFPCRRIIEFYQACLGL